MTTLPDALAAVLAEMRARANWLRDMPICPQLKSAVHIDRWADRIEQALAAKKPVEGVQVSCTFGHDANWPCDICKTPKTVAVQVDDAMVLRACNAYDKAGDNFIDPAEYPSMHAALIAAAPAPRSES